MSDSCSTIVWSSTMWTTPMASKSRKGISTAPVPFRPMDLSSSRITGDWNSRRPTPFSEDQPWEMGKREEDGGDGDDEPGHPVAGGVDDRVVEHVAALGR